MTLSAKSEVPFVRYDSLGNLEAFQCPVSVAYQFHAFHSGSGGSIVVGECPKDSRLTEHMAEEQAARFNAALLAANATLTAPQKELTAFEPQVVRDQGTAYIHFKEPIFPGVGGVGVAAGILETLLMIPPASETVIFMQGTLTSSECAPSRKLLLCEDFRHTMRKLARQIYIAQKNPAPSPPPRQEPLRPGRWTICDSVVRVIREALEQSDEKGIPVTETVRYKQHDQPDIRAGMRDAAQAHAQGTDISTAARNVGEQCLNKLFKL